MSNVNRLGLRNIQKVNSLEMSNFDEGNIFYSLEEYLNRIEDIDFINQTLSKSKKNSANGYYYLYDGTFLGNYGISKEIVVCAKKATEKIKRVKKNGKSFYLQLD